MGISASKQLIFLEEKERYGCVGPLLIKFGRPDQQQYFLPKILAGEHIWCQGYSEPNAGSDLASLRTEAVLAGDHWVVNGQKIWTSLAMDANWIFLLVRTDKQAKKQDGISFLLVPMDTTGITVHPLTNIDRADEFCGLRLDLEDHKDLYETFVEKVRRGESLGPDVSMLKINQTELFQRITETMLDIAGEYGAGMGTMEGNPAGLFLQSRPATIYAGSNEIQRNILAKNVLELPG
jgi:alkylation response protein AidB-like acyl-CoA dehydrogenase